MNKNITFPKTLKCPTCHTVADDDVEYWLQDYEFPSWIASQCENPECENYCGDFKIELEIVVKVKPDWISVANRLPDDGQECWTFQPEGLVFPQRDFRVALHTYHENYHGDCGQMWIAIDSDNNYSIVYYAANYGFPKEKESEGKMCITHWQPLVKPEAPEIDNGS